MDDPPRGSPSSTPQSYAKILGALLLLLGAGIIALDLGAEDLVGDEYYLWIIVQNHLRDFFRLSHYAGILKFQFWICHWLFGQSLIGYRVPSAIFGVANLALVGALTGKNWRDKPAIALWTMAAIGFNAQVIFFARWGMSIYGEYVFLSTAIFFLFLKLSERPLRPREVVLATLVLCAAAWIYFALLIPVIVGGALAFWSRFRVSQLPLRRRVMTIAREMKYLALPAAMFAMARWVASSYWQLVVYRSANVSYFFSSSGYPHTLAGAGSFAAAKTWFLFRELLSVITVASPMQIAGHAAQPDRVIGTALVLLAGAGFSLFILFRELDRRMLFAAHFVALGWALTLALGFLGQFPFGRPRYAVYLLVPAALLAGGVLAAGWSAIVARAATLLGRVTSTKVPRVAMRVARNACWTAILVAVAGLGASRLVAFHHRRQAIREGYDRLISLVQDDRSDVMIVDVSNTPWMAALAPSNWTKAEKMDRADAKPSSNFLHQMGDSQCPPTSATIITWGLYSPWLEVSTEQAPVYRSLFKSDEWTVETWYCHEGVGLTRLVRRVPSAGKRNCREGTLAGAVTPEILSMNPDKVVAGQAFNRQPSGSSGLWVFSRNANSQTTVVFDGAELATTVADGNNLSAEVPEDKISRPGTYEGYLLDKATNVRSTSQMFTVQP